MTFHCSYIRLSPSKTRIFNIITLFEAGETSRSTSQVTTSWEKRKVSFYCYLTPWITAIFFYEIEFSCYIYSKQSNLNLYFESKWTLFYNKRFIAMFIDTVCGLFFLSYDDQKNYFICIFGGKFQIWDVVFVFMSQTAKKRNGKIFNLLL